jgi:hypothetical protein
LPLAAEPIWRLRVVGTGVPKTPVEAKERARAMDEMDSFILLIKTESKNYQKVASKRECERVSKVFVKNNRKRKGEMLQG